MEGIEESAGGDNASTGVTETIMQSSCHEKLFHYCKTPQKQVSKAAKTVGSKEVAF